MTIGDEMAIRGIHHLTAVSRDGQATLDFWQGVLGLRLVKQTVNFDDPGSYHLYFGDEAGRPGTLVTFFEWKNLPAGRIGTGGTHHVALETEDYETLLQWKRYLVDRGIAVSGPYNRVYFTSLYLADPDGLIVEIATKGPGWTVDEAPDALGQELRMPPPETMLGGRDEAAIAATTWDEPVPELTEAMRLRRLHHITAIATIAERTEQFWTETMGMRLVKRTVNFDNPRSPHLYFGVGDGASGTIVTYFAYADGSMPPAQVGAGLTHHFAMEVADREALEQWQERLRAGEVPTSELLDRKYFTSLYFTDPDGHILELATTKPGFTVDESAAELGKGLQLPPWLEESRAAIEGALTPLR